MSQLVRESEKKTPANNPRFRAIYDLLASDICRNWTRKEICDALGVKKTSHMIRLIEWGVDANYFHKAKFSFTGGNWAFCYWYEELPF